MSERESNIELRRQLQAAVPLTAAASLQSRVAELERALFDTDTRLQQQRAMAAAATAQLTAQHAMRADADAEVGELRRALLDVEQSSDESALVGKLEAELMTAKVAARAAERRAAELKRAATAADEAAARAELQVRRVCGSSAVQNK